MGGVLGPLGVTCAIFCLSFSSPAVEPGIQQWSRPSTRDTGKVTVAVHPSGAELSTLGFLTVALFRAENNSSYENSGDGENLRPAGPTPV